MAERRSNLAAALADFDAATIATIHGFCQEVLGGLGVAADVAPDTAFVEDVGDLLGEALDDLYVRRFRKADVGAMSRAHALAIASIAVANPGAPIEPPDTAQGLPGMRRRLAAAVRAELERRKRLAGLMTYDDLLTRLADALRGPEGEGIAARLRARYRVVLVDEFQDTDPLQWEIMRRAFGAGTLVLIGDPKQAIYAFRGADVYAYLEAADEAATKATLAVNRRSDQALLDAYDALFAAAKLGHEGIVYRNVRAAPAEGRSRLAGAPGDGCAARADRPSRRAVDGADAARLGAPGRGARARGQGSGGRHRPPAGLRRHGRGHAGAAGPRGGARAHPPTGRAGARGTRRRRGAGRDQRRRQRVRHGARARVAVAARGAGAPDVRAAGAGGGADAVPRLERRARRVQRRRGVGRGAPAAAPVGARAARPRRRGARRRPSRWPSGCRRACSRTSDGERELTDLRHVGQLLHAAATADQLGVAALTSWLRRRMAEADDDAGDEDRTRRLESDAEAVQVLTIHRSKGLEFPIVYLPYLWEPGYIAKEAPVAFHDPAAGDRRTIDVGLEGPDFSLHQRQHMVEQRGEDLRLAYVALTRARHQAVLWWAGTWGSRDSALTRLLFSRDAEGNVAPAGRGTPTDDAATERFEQLAAAAPPGCIAVERSALARPESWAGALGAAAELDAARFARTLDHGWRRTSYSDITAAAHEARVASEPEEEVVGDEPEPAAPPLPAAAPADLMEAALRATPSPLAEMPGGVQVGTFVHRVLEATDFTAPDLDAELARAVTEVQAWRNTDIGDPAATAAGLRAALETPLGPRFGALRLRDVARADRLDELAFELPLAGGDTPSGRVALDAIAAVLEAHLPADDPLAGYAARLADPELRRTVRGYLTGSIDLVVRGGGAYAVGFIRARSSAVTMPRFFDEAHVAPTLLALIRFRCEARACSCTAGPPRRSAHPIR